MSECQICKGRYIPYQVKIQVETNQVAKKYIYNLCKKCLEEFETGKVIDLKISDKLNVGKKKC